MALLMLAGLQLIPADIYEAADVDGAGPVRSFFQLTLPLMKGTIAVALVFRTLGCAARLRPLPDRAWAGALLDGELYVLRVDPESSRWDTRQPAAW
jgi:hypothetical protein